ncbi:MAG TPA: helix-turn-helix transcriptional regulator [Candidatus Acidoferrum sp.]|nr:helix-turn-helix transcriptional regulator [Candidatus Acidoferrum sp.]
MPSVGDRIREIREAQRLTQDQLAEKADISKGFLSEIENGKRNVSSEYLLRVANALCASVDYLLRGTTDVSNVNKEPVVISPELSDAAQRLNLSYAETIELLEAHRSVIARRSMKQSKPFSKDDWVALHKAIKQVFG